MIIRDWRGASIPQIAALFNRTAGERYRVDESLVAFNTVDSSVFDWGASLVMQDDDGPLLGFLAFKRSPSKLYRTNDPDEIHLCALGFDDPNCGFDLFEAAKGRIMDRGFSRIVFGADTRHFWPGVPLDVPMMNNFLTVQGFEMGAEVFDLERDLSGYEATRPLPAGAEFRPLGNKDLESLGTFLREEFPHRWRHDVEAKIELENDPSTVFGLLIDGRVRGFALLQREGAKAPMGGAVWHNALGPSWCALGPIGVAAELRGGGYGGALLDQALLHLSQSGGRRCLIDWTTLGKFYGKMGFEPTRRYRSAAYDPYAAPLTPIS